MTAVDDVWRNATARQVPRPEDEAPRKRRMPAFVVCLYLFLVADMFSGRKFGLPLGPDRLLFGTFLLLLAVDSRVRWRTWRVRPAAWIALGALAWAVASAHQSGTLTQKLGFFALLDRLAVPYLLFALAPVALGSRRSRIVLLQLLCGIGIYLGFTAIFEIIGPHALVYPSYIGDPNAGISYGRARGPFLSSDADATAMATCMFASFALRGVSTSTAWRRAAVLSALVCLAGVFLALTRAEWIGTTVALVVTGMLVPSVRRKVPAALAGVAVAIFVTLAVSPSLRQEVTARTSTVRSVDDRQNTNAAGVRALQAHPLFGIGWSEFIEHTSRYVRQAHDYPLTRTDIEIHNVPLARFTELGLLGGGLWVMSVLFGPVAAVFARRRRDVLDEAYRIAFVGVAIVWLIAIQFSPFPYPLPNVLVWLLAGVVLAPLGPAQASRTRRSAAVGRRSSLVMTTNRLLSRVPAPPPRHRRPQKKSRHPGGPRFSALGGNRHYGDANGQAPVLSFTAEPISAAPDAPVDDARSPAVVLAPAVLLDASSPRGAEPDYETVGGSFTPGSSSSIRGAASRGAALSSLQVTISRVLGLVGFVVLARFLSPADYGTAALANVFVAMLSTVAAGGLGQALVQREFIDRDYMDTTFWFAAVTGVLLTGGLAAMAFPLASAFGQPLLGPVLLVLSSTFLIIGVTSVQTALLQRGFRFGTIAQVSLVSNLAATAAGISLAVMHFGVWALVVQTLVQPAITSVMFWRASSYRPRLFVRRSYVRPIYRVSSQFLGQAFTDFLSQRTDDFLVGGRLGATALGVYSIAYRLISVMMDILGNSLRVAALPVFSRLQSRPEQLRRSYAAAIGLSGLVVMPCFAFVLAAAPQVVFVAFGSKWHAAVPLLRVFAVYGALEAVMIINQVFLQGAGAARTAFRLSLAGTILQVVGFIIAFRFGLVWVASAYVLRSYVIAPVGLRRAAALVGTSTMASVARIGKPFLASALMAGVVFLVGRELASRAMPLQLAVMLAVGIVVYCAIARMLMRHHVADLRLMISSLRPPQTSVPEAAGV